MVGAEIQLLLRLVTEISLCINICNYQFFCMKKPWFSGTPDFLSHHQYVERPKSVVPLLLKHVGHASWKSIDALHSRNGERKSCKKINHYGPPTLAPWFVKIAPARNVFIIQKHPLITLSFGRFSGFLDRDVEHIFVLILICVREPKHWVATPQVASPLAQAYGGTTSYVFSPFWWFTTGRISPFFFK